MDLCGTQTNYPVVLRSPRGSNFHLGAYIAPCLRAQRVAVHAVAMPSAMLGLALPLDLQQQQQQQQQQHRQSNVSAANSFNLAKARADAVAASVPGSRASSFRSRRHSVGSQMSHMSYSSKRSMRSGKMSRYGRPGKTFKAVEIIQPDMVQVFDEHGKNVTPKPLATWRPTALHERLLQIPTDRLTPESERPSAFSPFSMTSSITPDMTDEDGPERDGEINASRRSGGAGLSKDVAPRHTDSLRRVHFTHTSRLQPASQQDPEKTLSVVLCESNTFDVLNLRGYTLNNTYENVKDVLDRNSKYKKLLQLKLGSDNYSNSTSQTLVNLQKSKEVQVTAKSTETEACQVNSWDIYDSFTKSQQATKIEMPEVENRPSVLEKGSITESAEDAHIASLLVSAGYLESPSAAPSNIPSTLAQRHEAGNVAGLRRGSLLANMGLKRGSTSATFAASRRGSTVGSVLPSRRESISGSVAGSRRGSATGSIAPSRRGSIMGTITSRRGSKSGTLTEELLPTRGYLLDMQGHGMELAADSPLLTEDASVGQIKNSDLNSIPGLLKALELAERALAQNSFHDQVSKDMLTIGYGQFEFGCQKEGLIGFWSLKNPCHPHATIATLSGVTSLDFSLSNPNLLAVGFYNGNIAIYDVRNPKESEPMVQSGLAVGKHNDPVWKVQWIDSTSELGESLVSISTDGKVTQWFLKKGLEYVNLLTLKRIASNSKGAQPQPFISRRAAGMCFDFSPRDSSIYLVGTEEGRIHKCSRSYNEQYLQTYVGHIGPVFQVRWSPFLSSLFLSCSSDWTVRLWHEDQDTCLLVFQSGTQCLQDVRWSLMNACVFGTVSDDGHLEIWDLSVSVVKPTIINEESRKLSCLHFGQMSPIIVSAGNNGAASVFRLIGFNSEDSEAEEIFKLKRALSSNLNIPMNKNDISFPTVNLKVINA